MTGGNLYIAYIFIASAFSVIILIIGTLLAMKSIRGIQMRKKRKIERELTPYYELLKQSLGREEALPLPGRSLNNLERTVLQEQLIEWIVRVDGQARTRLVVLCEEIGLVERELKRLSKGSSMRRSQAAYRLGMMRSKLAAAPLLEQLREHQTYTSSLFVYARALALCARGTDDLEQLVKEVVKHGPAVQPITAAILEEAGGDTDELLAKLQQNGNPTVRGIAERMADPRSMRLTAPRTAVKRKLSKTQQHPSSRAI